MGSRRIFVLEAAYSRAAPNVFASAAAKHISWNAHDCGGLRLTNAYLFPVKLFARDSNVGFAPMDDGATEVFGGEVGGAWLM